MSRRAVERLGVRWPFHERVLPLDLLERAQVRGVLCRRQPDVHAYKAVVDELRQAFLRDPRPLFGLVDVGRRLAQVAGGVGPEVPAGASPLPLVQLLCVVDDEADGVLGACLGLEPHLVVRDLQDVAAELGLQAEPDGRARLDLSRRVVAAGDQEEPGRAGEVAGRSADRLAKLQILPVAGVESGRAQVGLGVVVRRPARTAGLHARTCEQVDDAADDSGDDRADDDVGDDLLGLGNVWGGLTAAIRGHNSPVVEGRGIISFPTLYILQ